MKDFDLLKQEFLQLSGISLDDAQFNAAHRYADLLHTWNQKINLTGLSSPEDIRIKHFLDSLSCQQVLKDTSRESIVDVGTGGGFPGLPLKLLYPEMRLTLVESTAKKTAFLSLVVQELGLKQVEVVNARAEEIGQNPEHRESYDWAVARAVALLPVLAEYLLPLVRVGGRVIAQKGETAPEEVESAGEAIEILGGQLSDLQEVDLPGIDDKRFLVVIGKVAPTPEKYPRRVGIPAKRPLGK
ncbi:MAG: 16S rRNA (guanine(527)-N(7))-methyltransferase RsmG [Anaerolineales bacterium]|jgi:16S rRNA (guanine527-N7)-methyltransferase